jgi:hypothetical protein
LLVAEWCTVTVIDTDGSRHSLDVLADGTYDAAHLFLTHSKASRGSGLPVPNRETTFEIAAKGKIFHVTGAKLREGIIREWTERKGPRGYLFQKRAKMD